jgi:hypothetical protein
MNEERSEKGDDKQHQERSEQGNRRKNSHIPSKVGVLGEVRNVTFSMMLMKREKLV